MKGIGTALAVFLLAAMFAGAGYGIFAGYKLISSQWRILNSDWRACLIIIAAVLILCSLFISTSIGSYIKKHGLTSTGKVMAYNEFIRWYSDLKSELPDAVDPKTFKELRNQLMLWGNRHVVKQTNLLVEILQNYTDKEDQIMTQAERVFGEIKRELRYRSYRRDRDII